MVAKSPSVTSDTDRLAAVDAARLSFFMYFCSFLLFAGDFLVANVPTIFLLKFLSSLNYSDIFLHERFFVVLTLLRCVKASKKTFLLLHSLHPFTVDKL